MKIKEVSKKTNLTKKAIEYYIEKELLTPTVLENGYREFSSDDIERLNTISIYRKLGLSISEIHTVLNTPTSLVTILNEKSLQLDTEEEKQKILQRLNNGESFNTIKKDLEVLERKMTIMQKLLDMFPGYYGTFLRINFNCYLNEFIETPTQQKAFDEIIEFLDNAPKLELPKEFQTYLDNYICMFEKTEMHRMIKEKEHNIENYEAFIKEHQKDLKEYIAYKQSEEYKNSPIAKWMELMKDFCQTSGYYDIFIPALRRLSPSYNSYYEKLLKANEQFTKDYPETQNW